MFFYLSKIGWFFIQPSNLLLALAILGALLAFGRFARLGRFLLGLALTLLVICGFSPLGHVLLLPLEERFPAAQFEPGAAPDGIILLGGALDSNVATARGMPILNEAAERVTEFARLAARYPQARLIFTGGSAAILFGGATEADVAGELLESLGVARPRLELEDRSRNTWQNAIFTRELADPQPDERWLVVTSAWHMPRAIGAFRAAGFPVEPMPVDYRTRGWEDAWRPFAAASEGLRRTDVAVREWIGLIAYRLTGRTSALLPAPEE